MESLARFILRLVLVPLGVAVALPVALTILLTANWGGIVALANANPDAQGSWFVAFLFAGPVLAVLFSFVLLMSLSAAAIGVLIAEAFALRSWIYHAANGGLSAWIGVAMTSDIQEKYRFLTEPKVMVAAGLAGGLAYWLVAGWSSGFWKPVFGPKPATTAVAAPAGTSAPTPQAPSEIASPEIV
jgi:hypothetical protein